MKQKALAQTIKPVRTYECWVPAWDGTELGHRMRYTRHTAGQAKQAFFEMLRDLDYIVNWGQLHWFHPQGDRVQWLNDDGSDFEVAA